MAVKDSEDVEVDNQYRNLSPKRQEIVDAWVELYNESGEEPKNIAVADRADANESYTSQTLTDHKNIARRRADIETNQRDEGTETTEGDPFAGKLDATRTPQTIQERPSNGETNQQNNVPVDDTDEKFVYRFDPQEVKTMLQTGEISDDLYNSLMSEVVDRAFDD